MTLQRPKRYISGGNRKGPDKKIMPKDSRVHKTGGLCAMHVVDGYRISLLANGQNYEVRSNLNGEQIIIAPGELPSPAG